MSSTRVQTLPRLKRILAPTDFSPAAEPALQWATSLSVAFGAELGILNVLDVSLSGIGGLPLEFAALPAAAELIDLLRAELKTEITTVAARYPKAKLMVRETLARTGV